MALCTVQDGLDYLANLRLSENEPNLSTTALTQQANEITDDLKETFEKLGYLAEDEDPETSFDAAQLLLAKDLAATELAQRIMSDRSEAIDPRLLGIQKAQKTFTRFHQTELKIGRYYPIFNPTEYSSQIGGASTIPTARPTYSSTVYSTVTLVQYLCPGWTPDSANQVTTSVCQDWINRQTIGIYALALTRGYTIMSLTLRQARTLGKIINLAVAAFVLQANGFAETKQQVSVTAFDKIKEYLELRNNLIKGEFDQTFLALS